MEGNFADKELPILLIHEEKEEWEVTTSSRKKQTKRRGYPAVAARRSTRAPESCGISELTSSTTGQSNLPSFSFSVLNS